MNSLLVVGSVALDDVETPESSVCDALSGSATFFSAAASLFAPVRLVGIVGDDFPTERTAFLKERGVDFEGLEVVEGRTFRWSGRYDRNLKNRETIFLGLNVFEDFHPVIPESYKNTPFVFLANIQPSLQLEVLEQLVEPRFVAADTMNCWIGKEMDKLKEVIRRVDLLFVNDEEAVEITGDYDLIHAAGKLIEMGPELVIIKKGGHGATINSKELYFTVPAYPTDCVVDPTGAGDSFAGGVMGNMTRTGDLSEINIKKALVYGSVVASFAVESFSVDRLEEITLDNVEERVERIREITIFD